MIEQPVKICKNCQESLPLWSFFRDSRTQDRLKIYCKSCHTKMKKKSEVEKLRDRMPNQVAYKYRLG